MTIRVCSFDFDGCLFNLPFKLDWNRPKDVPRVIYHNETFLDGLKEKSNAFSKTITFIGSSRQSEPVERVNTYIYVGAERHYRGASFPAIQEITDYLMADNQHPVIFDPLLLSDIYADLDSGVSYYRGLSENYTGEHAHCRFDKTKLSILYAQMHKVASEHPEEKIEFNFYDDRKKILDDLGEYFKQNTKTIPANLTLNLYRYNIVKSDKQTLIQSFKGEGEHDTSFRQTIKSMGEYVAGIQGSDAYEEKSITFTKEINHAIIEKIRSENREQQDLVLAELDDTLKTEFSDLLNKRAFKATLPEKLLTLESGPIERLKTLSFDNESDSLLHKACIDEIGHLVDDFKKTDMPSQANIAEFKLNCASAIDTLDMYLRYNHDWRPMTNNLLLCLTVVGVPLAIYSGANRLLYGRYTFFDNTVSDARLAAEKKAVLSMDFYHA